MMTGRPVSMRVLPSRPPVRSYRSTWSRTHWEELGRYSPSRICVVMFLLGRLSNPPDRCTGAQENTGHDIPRTDDQMCEARTLLTATQTADASGCPSCVPWGRWTGYFPDQQVPDQQPQVSEYM